MDTGKTTVIKHIPIHYAFGGQTVCGLHLAMDVLISCNPRRTTCRNCTKTAAWTKAFAALKNHRTSSGSFVQPELFTEAEQ